MAERLAQEPGIELRTLRRHGADDEAWSALSEAGVYQISSAKDELPRQFFADARLLARCPRLLCVSANGAGYDTVDVEACTEAGVLVVNQAGANAQAVAEAAIALMLNLSRRIVEADRRLHIERGFSREDLMGQEISGKTLGLIGIGHIGRAVARLAAAFGMEVLVHDPLLDGAEIAARGGLSVALDELLARSDVVSVHCPRDASTLGLFDAETFARMKQGAVFINTARGGIHDEVALYEALRSGHLRGAGLDVWEQEPPPLDHPLLGLPHVVAGFHTAGVTQEARWRMAFGAAEQIVAVLRGERPARLVNPQAWQAWRARFAGHPA
nr:hydroxyacid dehydrogenase [Xylophilus rhododendri]